MRLVDDDRVVLVETAVPLRLGEQHAVGEDLDEAVAAGAIVEPDLVADAAAERLAQLLGDPRRHAPRRDPTRLRVPDRAGRAAPEREADLGKLRRLARAGLAAHDDDLVPLDRGGDLVALRGDGQLVGKGRFRSLSSPPLAPLDRRVELRRDLLDDLGPWRLAVPPASPSRAAAAATATEPAQSATQPRAVGEHAPVEPGPQAVEGRFCHATRGDSTKTLYASRRVHSTPPHR